MKIAGMISVVLHLVLFGAVCGLPSAASALPAENPTAARHAAEQDPLCTPLRPFYWEIGSAEGVLASGQTGDRSVARSSVLGIASASKWVFGAYVVQRENGKIDGTTRKFLELASGYNSLPVLACVWQPTAEACLARRENSRYTPAADGRFFYNGGHFEKWGVDHGLGSMDRQDLSREFRRVLGPELPVEFATVQFAGGLRMSAQGYALFLQKILRGHLLIRDRLGESAICTLPSDCPGQAIQSPIPAAWHYSYGHWIEDDRGGDGAFSSPGAFGFYPWIDRSKRYYGILSRRVSARAGAREPGAGYMSALCGQRIRRAFLGQE
jgi:hypothetical protein